MASEKQQAKINKSLRREMPYFGKIVSVCHGKFNNLLPFSNLPSKKYLENLPSLYDVDLLSLNFTKNSDHDLTAFPFIRCKYYSPHSFNLLKQRNFRYKRSFYTVLYSGFRPM